MKTKSLLLVLLAGALLSTGCLSPTIARINADPTRYQNRTLRVSGTVVTSVGVLGTGGYQIDDGTGKIFVVSRTGVPGKGSRITVTGRVQAGVTVLGRSYGTAIREERHKVH